MLFLADLRERNKLLFAFGFYNLLVGIACLILVQSDEQEILGISRWIKPAKFFLSVWIMTWTMAWLLYYLQNKRSVRIISWLIVISMFIENFIILMQSYRMQASHFNVKTPLDGILFGIMGLFIIVFTVAASWATILFFIQKNFEISASYLWGIRLGMLLFLIFSIEGGFMLRNMGHTVGAADGGPGLPFTNWSTKYGDLRIAHFLGMHALQVLPLAGYYVFKKTSAIIVFSLVYFVAVSVVLWMAFEGRPLLNL